MNTTAHILVGTAAFGRADSLKISFAALLGALLPDISLYVLASVSILFLGIPAQVVFDELYFSDSWQTIFSIDNSIILWGAILCFAFFRKHTCLIAFSAAGLLHVLTDFMMHHDDARAHFWPFSDWRFASPISYWDSAHHAQWVAPLEGLVAFICAMVLWRRYTGRRIRASVAALVIVELVIIHQWLKFF